MKRSGPPHRQRLTDAGRPFSGMAFRRLTGRYVNLAFFPDFPVNQHQTVIAVIFIQPENPVQNTSFPVTPRASFHLIIRYVI